MSLITYQSPALSLSSLFDGLFDPWDRAVSSTLSPNVDVIEEKDAFKLQAEIPGMDKKDIVVEVSDGVLSIRGEKKEEKFEKDKDRYCHFERSYGSFKREFKLPEDVDPEQIDAKYTNGVLELVLKKTEKAKPKQVDIKVA
jgi:HSP20 family protein